jgi:hypothetical protein
MSTLPFHRVPCLRQRALTGSLAGGAASRRKGPDIKKIGNARGRVGRVLRGVKSVTSVCRQSDQNAESDDKLSS